MQCLNGFCRALDISQKMETENVRASVSVINRTSSLLVLVSDVETATLPEVSTHRSVTEILEYCKKKILNPYLRLLSIMGLRQFSLEQQDSCTLGEILSNCYMVQIIIFMLIGYFLQYMACFRRDRGFCYKPSQVSQSSIDFHTFEDTVDAKIAYRQICEGSIIFSFIFPNSLHLIAYLHAVAVCRSSDDDQLPSLMERVFLSSANLSDGFCSQKKLVKTLWLFVISSLIWMVLSFTSVNFMMAEGSINFKWVESNAHFLLILLKIILVVCTLWHDMIQATIISNYCLQAQLLTSYVHFLREKLVQYPVQPVEWMREIEEFKKMLKYFNHEITPAVCILTVVNISCTASGIVWLLHYDRVDRETLPIVGISIVNVILWIIISVAPFIQATRLTNACERLQEVGHEVRIKPFVHQDTPVYELDSLLLYTSSLRLSARLFCLPITGRYLCFVLTFVSVVILVLGQCHYLSI